MVTTAAVAMPVPVPVAVAVAVPVPVAVPVAMAVPVIVSVPTTTTTVAAATTVTNRILRRRRCNGGPILCPAPRPHRRGPRRTGIICLRLSVRDRHSGKRKEGSRNSWGEYDAL